MTPQFITPCFVRVEDTAKRKEVIKALIEMRGAPVCISEDIYNPILCDTDYWLEFNMSNTNPKYLLEYVNCGTDIDLFLALAGMRSDTDNGQYFIDERDGSMNFSEDDDIGLSALVYRKATATEIIEHFNNESK